MEFDPDHYPRLRIWNPPGSRDYYAYLHRLPAVAQGEIADLWDRRHVHHDDAHQPRLRIVTLPN